MMQIVGDRVSKIGATRVEALERPLKIKTDVKLNSVSKKELYATDEKRDGLAIDYSFEVVYGDKSSASIQVDGTIFAFGENKELDEAADSWKKDKKIAPELMVPLLNRAMELGYLSAIPVAKELKLPTPLKLPRFVPTNEEIKDAKKAM